MAREYWDGFDVYSTGVGENIDPARWVVAAGSIAANATGRFSGSRSMGVSNGGTGIAVLNYMVASPTADFSFAVAFRGNTIYGGFGPVMIGATTSGYNDSHVGLLWNADGSLSVIRRTGTGPGSYTVLATSVPGILVSGQWIHLAGYGTIHDTTGSFILHVNGSPNPLFNLTNIDTRNGTSAVAASICLGIHSSSSAIGTGNWLFDDFVFDNGTGVLIPERRVIPQYTNADGATLNLTPSSGVNHYAVLDEQPMSATDYLSGSTVGHFDLLGLTNLSYIPAAIDGVAVRGFAAKTDAVARAVNYGLKSGATDSLGSDIYLGTTTSTTWRGLTTDPNTGLPWVKADIDALELKLRIAA